MTPSKFDWYTQHTWYEPLFHKANTSVLTDLLWLVEDKKDKSIHNLINSDQHENCGRHRFGGKLMLDHSIGNDETNTFQLPNLNLKSQFPRYPFSYLRLFKVCGRFVGVKVGVTNICLGQSVGVDENNTFQLKFLF